LVVDFVFTCVSIFYFIVYNQIYEIYLVFPNLILTD
jgi:hypothetical protein